MFPIIWILFPVLISSETISMPLLNDLKATLKADVDVTEMNKYLQAYIQEEVKKGVANALAKLVEDIVNNKTVEAELRITEKLQEEVKKDVANYLPTLVEDIVNNKTVEAELRITEKLQKEVKTGVTYDLPTLVEEIVNNKTVEAELRITEKLQKEVKKGVTNALPTLVEDIVKNNTEEAELRITEKLQERQQYAFFATVSSSKNNLPKDSVVVFDQASLNVGEVYDDTTGKFTCKVDGLYTFSWTTMSSPKKDLTTDLITNGRRVAINVVDTDESADFLSSSSTVLVRMRKGEQTWISVVKGDQLMGIWDSAPVSMFSGFKIN